MTDKTDKESFKVVTEVQIELASLIPNFLKNRKNEILRARDLVKSGDFAALKKLAHSMKGACMSFGFHASAKIAGAIESAAQSKDLSSLEFCLLHLQTSLEKTEIHYV